MERHARISRRQGGWQRDALGEDGSLESVAVDAFFEVDPRSLLDAKPDPRPPRHPVVQIELPVRVLDAEDEAVARHRIARRERQQAALPRDVRCDSECDDVREVAGDVDVGTRDVETVPCDGVTVRVSDFRIGLDVVVGKQRHPNANRGGVVRRRISGCRRNLGGRRCRASQQNQPGSQGMHEFHVLQNTLTATVGRFAPVTDM